MSATEQNLLLDDTNTTLASGTHHNKTQEDSALMQSEASLSYAEEVAWSCYAPQPTNTSAKTACISFVNDYVTQHDCSQNKTDTSCESANPKLLASGSKSQAQDTLPTQSVSTPAATETVAPKLTAMNLFAYRNDTLSSVLTECFSNQQQASWPTTFMRRDERTGSMNSQTTFEIDGLLPEQQISSFMEKINTNNGEADPATVSSLNSSGSSLTEHIFANALSNLEDSSCSDDDV